MAGDRLPARRRGSAADRPRGRRRRRFLAGEPQDQIIADLTARGILTSYGKPWTRAGFRQVLSRPINCGQITHLGKVVARLSSEPIISEEDFAEVLARYAARRPGRPPSSAYLCSGIAMCGLCGTRLVGRPRNGVRSYADGGVNRQYYCSKSHGGCGRIAADQRAMDVASRELAIASLSDAGQSAKIEAEAAESRAEAAALDTAIAEIDALVLQLSDRLGRGKLTLERYDAATGPLDARLARLRARREALGSAGARSRSIPLDSEKAWRARWEAAEPAERRDLLRLALRGRRLVVSPADPQDRTNIARRLSLQD